MRRTALLAACLSIAAIGTGCGSDNNKSSSESTTTSGSATPSNTAKPAAGTSSGTVAVSIKDIKFNPHDVTVKVGQTIKWTNNDAIAHTVTAKSGAKFDSKQLDAGKTFTFKATKAGTINYVCLIHPGQDGSITVTK